jgi:formamidopyrimidine-DNA glycosylase
VPELPEVEVARRCLERWLVGHTIVHASAPRSRLLGGADPRRVRRFLERERASSAERRGKHLLAVFESGRGLHVHLGMTGRFIERRTSDEAGSHARLVLDLEDGSRIVLRDPRMFGQVEIGEAEALRRDLSRSLGPDPLIDPFSGATLYAILSNTKRAVKIALMDQKALAGIGNIQASEALWRARIHPGRPGASLDRKDASRLAKGILKSIEVEIETLERDLARESEAPSDLTYLQDRDSENPFMIYGREGEPCPRCRRGRILRREQGGRSTYFCPRCQVC